MDFVPWTDRDPCVLFSRVQSGLVLAILGSIDSLLTSLVADSLSSDRIGAFHDSNKELIGQGMGNACSGLFGGVGGAGATMRTVVNIKSGAETGLSGAFHSVVLAAAILGLGGLVQFIPKPTLAGILLKTGVDVIDWSFLRKLPRLPSDAALVGIVTIVLTVFVDLIAAVGVGLALAMLLGLLKNQSLQQKGCNVTEVAHGVLEVTLDGPFDFSSSESLMRTLSRQLKGKRAVIFNLSTLTYMDSSMLLMLEELSGKLAGWGATQTAFGANDEVIDAMARLGIQKGFVGDAAQSRDGAMAAIQVA